MERSDLQAMKLFQLKKLASRLGIPGRTKMDKAQIVEALVGKEITAARRAKAATRRPPARMPAGPRVAASTALAETPPSVEQKPASPPAEAATAPAPPKPPAPKAEPEHTHRKPHELPQQYNQNRIVLMPRDPNRLYAYWEITSAAVRAALQRLGVTAGEVKTVLRVHDVTDPVGPDSAQPQLEHSREYLSIETDPTADEWYINAARPNRLYCIERLFVAPDGRAVSLAVSNLAATPSDHISDVRGETWVAASRRGAGTFVPTAARNKWLAGQERAHETMSSYAGASSNAAAPATKS